VVDGNIWTSSGVEAGTDMAAAFIKEVFGTTYGETLGNVLEHVPHTDPTWDPFSDLYNLTGIPIPPPPAPPIPDGIPKSYGIVLYPGFGSLDTFSVLESLHFAPNSSIAVIAASTDPVTSNIAKPAPPLPYGLPGLIPHTGPHIIPTHTFETAPPLDVLIIPGAPRGREFSGENEVAAFVASRYDSLRYVLSIGTGTSILVKSGVTQGKNVTTSKYWWHEVSKPASSHWVKRGRWVADGKVWTASGVFAGFDMIYAFVKEVYSPAWALWISQTIEYVPNTDPSWDPFSEIWHVS
jgi:transcriptional regulator GlxA family with amidase domain